MARTPGHRRRRTPGTPTASSPSSSSPIRENSQQVPSRVSNNRDERSQSGGNDDDDNEADLWDGLVDWNDEPVAVFVWAEPHIERRLRGKLIQHVLVSASLLPQILLIY